MLLNVVSVALNAL